MPKSEAKPKVVSPMPKPGPEDVPISKEERKKEDKPDKAKEKHKAPKGKEKPQKEMLKDEKPKPKEKKPEMMPAAEFLEVKVNEMRMNIPKSSMVVPAALPFVLREAPQQWAALEAILNPEPVNQELLPDDYCCSITSRLMREPVTTSDGQTYEREAIEEWLLHHNTSPLAGSVPLKNKTLTPVLFVKNAVEKLLDKHPELRDSREWYLPESWIRELASACDMANEAAIRELAARDRRLLVHTFGSKSGHEGKTALQLAVLSNQSKSLDVVVELLEKREKGLALAALLHANPLFEGILPIHQVILDMRNCETLLKIMSWMGEGLEKVVAPRHWPVPIPALHDSVTDSNLLQILHTLNNALLWSVRRGDAAKVACLLRLRANPDVRDEKGKRALYLGVERRAEVGEKAEPGLLKLLLQAGANPNATNLSGEDAPLHSAIRQNLLATALELKLAGANLDLKLKDGTTPLHLVAAKKNCRMADALWGPPPAKPVVETPTRGPEGRTPMLCTAVSGSFEMLIWLLSRRKGDFFERDANGRNMLHFAALYNHLEYAQGVLNPGYLGNKYSLELDLSVPDNEGNTPLHLAAEAGSTEVAVWLLAELGALPTKNRAGLLPHEIAESKGHTALANAYMRQLMMLRSEESRVMVEEGAVGDLFWKQARLIQLLESRLDQQEKKLLQQEQEIARLRAEVKPKKANKPAVERKDEPGS